jgi:hypothetical protein
MKKVVLPIATHLLFAFIVYQWLFAGSEGAHNCAVFLIWVQGLIGLMCFAYSCSSRVDASLGRSSRFAAFVTGVIELVMIAALVWYGHFLLAVVLGVSYVGVAVLRDVARKARPA